MNPRHSNFLWCELIFNESNSTKQSVPLCVRDLSLWFPLRHGIHLESLREHHYEFLLITKETGYKPVMTTFQCSNIEHSISGLMNSTASSSLTLFILCISSIKMAFPFLFICFVSTKSSGLYTHPIPVTPSISKICGLLSPPTVRTGLTAVLGVSEMVSFAIFWDRGWKSAEAMTTIINGFTEK